MVLLQQLTVSLSPIVEWRGKIYELVNMFNMFIPHVFDLHVFDLL